MATVQATPIAASATKPPVPKKKPTIPPKPSAPAKALTATPSSEEGESVSFNNQLKGIAWRIDVKTRTKHIKELNEAAAIVELDVKGAEVNNQPPQTRVF